MTEAALAQKTCTPCRGGVPPLDPEKSNEQPEAEKSNEQPEAEKSNE